MGKLSQQLAEWLGRPSAFVLAGALPVVVWLLWGPAAHYSDTWQLVINTGTTVLTYLFMFLIQRSQNANSLALQLKLDGLIAAIAEADNRLIDVETKTETEMLSMKRAVVK